MSQHMASWEGFSESDLQRLKGSGSVHSYNGREGRADSTPVSKGRLGQKQSRKSTAARSPKKPAATSVAGSGAVADSEPRSSPDQGDGSGSRPLSRAGLVGTGAAERSGASGGDNLPDTQTSAGSRSVPSSGTTSEVDVEVRPCTEEELQAMKRTRLDDIHEQQKKLEKVNLEKKTQLQKTIAQRKEQAQKETRHLAIVQKELSHLDNIVSSDVSILRERIEQATTAFNEAQQRYDAAEAEFVTSKLHLHRCSEQKELLMEHLVTIIEQTELRKASKLSELMGSLDDAPSSQREKKVTEKSVPRPPAPAIAPAPGKDSVHQDDAAAEEEVDDTPPAPVTLLGLAQSAGEDDGEEADE